VFRTRNNFGHRKKEKIIMLFGKIFNSNCQPSDHTAILSREEFQKAISNADVQLIDVRTPHEYRRGNIERSINIDLFQPTVFHMKIQSFNKEKPIYIYCRSGVRSQKAARKLMEMGFKQIFDLKGGYTAWNA